MLCEPGSVRNPSDCARRLAGGMAATRSRLAHVVTWDYTEIMVANVRTAKARLSELLDRAAAGEEIVITSDGRPKAKLVGIPPVRATYRVNRRLLAVSPRKAGPSAQTIIRQDRDGRD